MFDPKHMQQMIAIMEELMEAVVEKKEKKMEVRRDFKFCKSLTFAIQNITKEQTHEIVSNLVEIADKLIEEHEIDPTDPKGKNFNGCGKNIKHYVYYPGTKVYMGVYLTIEHDRPDYRSRRGRGYRKVNVVRYSFKLPQSYIDLDDKQFEDMMTEGLLMDFSLDVNEPSLRSTKTPAQIRREQEEKKRIREAKAAERKAARLAKRANKSP